MSPERAPERDVAIHLARALDEVLRACAAGAELLAARLDGRALGGLRAALRDEVSRWDARADEDPAAARVRDLFAAILDVLEPGARETCASHPKPGTRIRRRSGAR